MMQTVYRHELAFYKNLIEQVCVLLYKLSKNATSNWR